MGGASSAPPCLEKIDYFVNFAGNWAAIPPASMSENISSQKRKSQDAAVARNDGSAGSSAGFTAGTRERILRMLLSSRRSVSSLASELGITKNAVRAQLFQLEKQGLVGARGEERTSRRPSALYGLMPGAEARFSRAYPAAFSGLIRVLSRKLPPKEFEQAMRVLGWGMAGRGSRPEGEPDDARCRFEIGAAPWRGRRPPGVSRT